MMRHCPLLFALLFCEVAFCQSDTVYFAKSFNKSERCGKKGASFFRVIQKDSTRYKIDDFGIKGNKIVDAYSLYADSMVYDGYFASYYENGRKFEYGNYVSGIKVGQWKIKYMDTDRIFVVIDYFPSRKDTTQQLISFYKNGKLERTQFRINGIDTGVCFSESGEVVPFTQFDKMPEFNGDVNEFLATNLRYPIYALENGHECIVKVAFVVKEDGSVEAGECWGAYPELCQEAKRLVASMPKWKPGKQYGKPVRVYFTLPIVFRLP
jgi:hypothetical protein